MNPAYNNIERFSSDHSWKFETHNMWKKQNELLFIDELDPNNAMYGIIKRGLTSYSQTMHLSFQDLRFMIGWLNYNILHVNM